MRISDWSSDVCSSDLWQFSDSALADTIRTVWLKNPSTHFRFELLRIIREGAITDCVDLARSIALDKGAADYHRIIALDAAAECQDEETLRADRQRVV